MRWSTSGIDPRAEDGLWGSENRIDWFMVSAVTAAYSRWCYEMRKYLDGRS